LTAAPKAHVLVIDDEPEMRMFLALWFIGFGCQVRTAENAEAAQRALAAQIPDLILLDVVLPGLNGFEICLRLKQHKTTQEVPVVMMSGLREPANQVRARELGAKHFLQKPFDESQLAAVVGSLVSAA
jgi:diguanylate cyclase